MREIKFRLIKDSKVVGYEMWHEDRWVYRFPEQENFSLYTPFIPHDSKDEYTGFKDKKGAEIYERDMLYHKIQGKRFVEFGSPLSSYGGYMLVSNNGMRGTLQDTEVLYEVIGNIYENKEFLKGE